MVMGSCGRDCSLHSNQKAERGTERGLGQDIALKDMPPVTYFPHSPKVSRTSQNSTTEDASYPNHNNVMTVNLLSCCLGRPHCQSKPCPHCK
jgi:hypothetical protein